MPVHTEIQVRNPELYDGFPVAFNIDLSGSLPELIQASLISRDFHSEILRYVHEKRRGQRTLVALSVTHLGTCDFEL